MNRKEYHLTEEDISSIVAEIKAFFISQKSSDKDVLKLELLIEEILLRFMDRFGRDQVVAVELSRFAIARARISLKAEPYNPLAEEEDSSILSSVFLKNLLDSDGTSTTYRYHNGSNEIISLSQKEHKALNIPGGSITIAVFLAIAAGLFTKQLPDEIASFLVNDLAGPLFNRLMRLVVLVMGPLIFSSVISGVCALNDVATLSSVGIRAIKRFVGITLLLTTYSVIISFLFFPGISAPTNKLIDPSLIIHMLLDLIPENLFSPFSENKTIQIVVIAAAIGIALLILDEKTPKLRALVAEVNQLIFTIMGFVSKIAPLTIFLSIYKAVTVNDLSSIMSVWKIVVSGYVIMVPFTACMVLYVCLRRKLNVLQFLRDISKPAIVGFTTCSGTMAMMAQYEIAKDKLKIDEKMVNFWVPLSQAMFSPSVIPPLVTAAFFAGDYYGTPISLPQILILYILVTQLSIASPKISGGIMATFTILLGQLGMPVDVVGLLMVANIFVVNAETGLAMVIRSSEMVEFSHLIKT